jgi:hypothetical protein
VKKNIIHKKHSKVNAGKSKQKDWVEFFTKYKGFTFALIATIVIIIAFFFVNFDLDLSQQKADYAKQMHENNVALFEEYNAVLGETISVDENETLTDDYTASMKDDVMWLAEKEKNIYNSNPRSDVFSKEVAITMLTQAIMQVNSDYAMQTGETAYSEKVDEALAIEIKPLKLLTKEEINSTFPTEQDNRIYAENLDLLWKEYLNSKQNLIKITSSRERKFVEARKLVWMTEYYKEEQ